MALTLVWELIALVFSSFWSCISQRPASPRLVSKSRLLSLLSSHSFLFILLLTFLLTLKAEVNIWKDWWPFNENVSIPVVGAKARTSFGDGAQSPWHLSFKRLQLQFSRHSSNVFFHFIFWSFSSAVHLYYHLSNFSVSNSLQLLINQFL